MRTSTGTWPRMQLPYGSAIGFAGGIVATAVATPDSAAAPVILVAAVSAVTTVFGALAAALQCWLLYASFIIGHTGELALNRASAETALLLLATAVVFTAAGAGIRRAQRPKVVSIPAPRSPLVAPAREVAEKPG